MKQVRTIPEPPTNGIIEYVRELVTTAAKFPVHDHVEI